jgi:hypothetical protein
MNKKKHRVWTNNALKEAQKKNTYVQAIASSPNEI